MLIAAVALLAGGLAARWAAGRAAGPHFHGTTYDEVSAAPPFALVDDDGRPVTLDSYRGEAVLLFFGYTHCPDVCPLTLARLSRVVGEMPERKREGVRILLVTLDPERDTPAVLRDYARRFGGRVTGLTGDSAALTKAWAGYGAYAQPSQAPPGTRRDTSASAHAGHGAHPVSPAVRGKLTHSAAVYGIDREGRLRVVISDMATEDEVRDDVRALAGL